MKVHTVTGRLAGFVLFIGCVGPAVAATDCELGSRYLALAQDRMTEFANDDAIQYLEQSVKVCPSYAAYQQLGEVSAQSTEAADKRRAVQAFVAAHELAQTREERSRSLYSYAQLLSREGDPQNAYPLVKDAEALTPENPEVVRLAQAIQAQIDNPTPQQIVRGLKDTLYEPLKIASVARLGPAAAPTRPAPRLVPPSGPSVNIPVNFITGSTRVDESTRANVATLAEALSSPDFTGKRFMFVGHADVRGDDVRNRDLSRQRAEAIYQAVVLLQPSLEGRIDVTGRGSAEPIDLGNDEYAWRANRRLQVLLR